MGDTSGCQISRNNLAVYLQGVSVEPSSNLTSQYFVTASLPSSASLRRVWQFTTQGTITGPDTATLTLDYTQAHINCPLYNITFEGALNGLLTIHNQVFSANKFMSYTLTSAYVLVLTLRVPKSIQECFGPGTTQNYSFSVFLNDAATPVLSFSYQTNDSLTSTDIYGTCCSTCTSGCTWCPTQQYYYAGAYTDPSGTQVYTGYLQMTGSSSSTCCFAPTTLALSMEEFPNPSGAFVAVLGIGYLNINYSQASPNSWVLEWTDVSGTVNNQTLSSDFTLNSPGYILVYNSSSSTPWSIQNFSANPFYLVTCIPGFSYTEPVNILASNGNVLYSSSSDATGEITIYPDSFPGTVYISFPSVFPTRRRVTIGGNYTQNTVYLTNSTGVYQGPFTVNNGSSLFYCTDSSGNNTVWQTSACSS